MAVSTIPWRRDGTNSWNDLVRRVNAVLENPPPDTTCEPIAPLPEVDECHQWSTQDITDMQDALKEACDTNEFTPVVECDKWTVSIIDEIEDAILVGFCDCDPLNPCAPPCDNQAPVEERFLLAESVLPPCLPLGESCGSCAPTPTLSTGLFLAYIIVRDVWINTINELCVLEEEVIELEEELEELQDELDDLTEQKNTECGIDPESASCLSLTAAVDAKQIEVDDKQIELDDKITERDEKALDEIIDLAALESAAVDTVSNAEDSAGHKCFLLSEIDLVTGTPGVPWTNFECDDPLKLPTCFGTGIRECSAAWKLQRRTVESPRKLAGITFPEGDCTCSDFDTLCAGGCPWLDRARGSWTPSGAVVVNPFSDCLARPTVICSCDPSADECDFACHSGCNHLISVSQINHEWRLVITFPEVRGNEACNTGDPCTLDPP